MKLRNISNQLVLAEIVENPTTGEEEVTYLSDRLKKVLEEEGIFIPPIKRNKFHMQENETKVFPGDRRFTAAFKNIYAVDFIQKKVWGWFKN